MTASAKDFRVGQRVFVRADQGIRKGIVSKVGRTRITIAYPRNLQGDMKEKAFGMDRVVVGRFARTVAGRDTGPLLLFGDGWFEPAANFRRITVLDELPVVADPEESP